MKDVKWLDGGWMVVTCDNWDSLLLQCLSPPTSINTRSTFIGQPDRGWVGLVWLLEGNNTSSHFKLQKPEKSKT